MVFLTAVLIICASVLTAIYYWSKYNNGYWKRKGIPYVRPTLLIGNTKEMFNLKNSFGLHISDTIYNDPKMSDKPVVGIFTMNKPSLVIRDPELVKAVLIKDFQNFTNRYGRCDAHCDALGSYNLFFVRSPYWKDIRNKLTPVFTSGKVKQMYPLMLQIAEDLEKYLSRRIQENGKFKAEIKDICALYTTDFIATTAFGVRANSLENPNSEFRSHGRKLFNFSFLRSLQVFFIFFLPKLVGFLRIKFFTKESTKFLRDTINYVMNERERSGTLRNDLIDILVTMKKEAALEANEKYFAKNNDFLVAQAAVFFTAGFETSSSTMSFTLYELSKRMDLQKRLRTEINEALLEEKNGVLTYEKIQQLEYLNMVVSEVLRLYPVLPFLDREYMPATIDAPKFNLKPHYNYELESGIPVFIPVYGLQRDPKYWSHPETFDPERFSPDNKQNINPMAYLPFGAGPHNCIGSRIGLLQTKMGLVHFLKNHYVRTCADTISEMQFDPKAFVLQSIAGIHLEIVNDRLYDDKASLAN